MSSNHHLYSKLPFSSFRHPLVLFEDILLAEMMKDSQPDDQDEDCGDDEGGG